MGSRRVMLSSMMRSMQPGSASNTARTSCTSCSVLASTSIGTRSPRSLVYSCKGTIICYSCRLPLLQPSRVSSRQRSGELLRTDEQTVVAPSPRLVRWPSHRSHDPHECWQAKWCYQAPGTPSSCSYLMAPNCFLQPNAPRLQRQVPPLPVLRLRKGSKETNEGRTASAET